MSEYTVRKTISINAEPVAVWDALTNPEKTKKYFFNCEVFSDWETGSPISFKGRIFFIKKIELNGQIIKIEPKKLLQYTLRNTGSTGHSTVTDKLSYENGVTELSITDDVGAGHGAQERFEKSGKGWDKVLKGLKNLVEKGN